MQYQPAALNRDIQASFVFVWRASLAKQERPVDQLDVDLAILHSLDDVGDLNDLVRAAFSESEKGRSLMNFIRHPYHANRATKGPQARGGHRRDDAAYPKSANLGSCHLIQQPRRPAQSATSVG